MKCILLRQNIVYDLPLYFTFQSISPFTGHYKTTDERFQSFLTFFKDIGVNLDEVQVKPFSLNNSTKFNYISPQI